MRSVKQAATPAAATFPALFATADGKTVILATTSAGVALTGMIVQTDDDKYGPLGAYRPSFPRADFAPFTGTVTLAN